MLVTFCHARDLLHVRFTILHNRFVLLPLQLPPEPLQLRYQRSGAMLVARFARSDYLSYCPRIIDVLVHLS